MNSTLFRVTMMTGDVPIPDGRLTLDWLKAMEALFNLIPGLYFFAKDREGRFIAANNGFAGLMSASAPMDIMGLMDIDVWPRHLYEKYLQDDQHVMATGKNLVNMVELIINANHSTDWITTTKVPLYDRENRIGGVAGFCWDLKQQSNQASLLHMGEVFDYVMRNYGSSIDLQDLAALTFLSVSQFERRFKALFRITPMKYLSLVRINAACQALAESDARISDIADRSGFYDPSHFNRQFQKTMGMSPRIFRRRYANTKDYPRVQGMQISSSPLPEK